MRELPKPTGPTRRARERCHLIALLAASAVVLVVLAACNGPASGATPTSTPVPPTPTNVPAGWQDFTGHYFSIAYPPGWTVTPNVQGTVGRPPGSVDVSYVYFSSDRRQSFIVSEEDQIAPDAIRSDCAAQGMSPRTVAGLPMHYGQYNDVNNVYSFLTPQGVAYGLEYTAQASDTQSITLYQQAFNTFRPVYTTSACK